MSEEEMRKMAEELRRMGAPAAIRITVRYNAALQDITHAADEPMLMSEGSTFMFLLQSVFESYPDITKRYPPGTIGMLLNDTPPTISSALLDGDVVSLYGRESSGF